MDIGKEILFFFSALGAFNGLLLGLFLLFFTQKKYLANDFLGALLLALSIRIAKSVCLYFDGKLPKIYLQIGLSACFFIGPFLYYFVRSAVTPLGKMPKSWLRTLIALAVVTLVVGITLPLCRISCFMEEGDNQGYIFPMVLFPACFGHTHSWPASKTIQPVLFHETRGNVDFDDFHWQCPDFPFVFFFDGQCAIRLLYQRFHCFFVDPLSDDHAGDLQKENR
jgi:hypothetical protein